MRLKTQPGERILKDRSSARPALAEHPVNLREIGHGQPFSPDEFMLGSGNNQNLIACDDSLHELLAMYGSFDKAQFRAASLDFRDHLRGIRHVEAYLDLRIGPSECDQTRGQPITGNRLAGVDRKHTPLQLAELDERQLGGVGGCEHRTRLLQKNTAGFRQFDVASNSVEQLRPVLRFKARDGVAGGGLRQIQSQCSLGNMLSLRDSDEDAKLIQSHG